MSGLPQLASWTALHPYNKILAGADFEGHVHQATALGVLWNRGGFYVNPKFKVTGKLNFPPCRHRQQGGGGGAWVSGTQHDYGEAFNGAYFPRNHTLLVQLAHLFAVEYPTKLNKHTPFRFDFQTKALALVHDACSSSECSEWNKDVRFEANFVPVSSPAKHFGTLSYEKRVKVTGVANLGDEVQSFAGLGFLPYQDTFLDRDALARYTAKENVTAFFNAWWGVGSSNWPPPATIHPIMISIHISQKNGDKLGAEPSTI